MTNMLSRAVQEAKGEEAHFVTICCGKCETMSDIDLDQIFSFVAGTEQPIGMTPPDGPTNRCRGFSGDCTHDAQFNCLRCEEFFCSPCWEVYHENKQHQRFTLEEYGQLQRCTSSSPGCFGHVEFFCRLCNAYFCSPCWEASHISKRHEKVAYNEQSERETVNAELAILLKELGASPQRMDAKVVALENNASEIKDALREAFELQCAEIDRKKQEDIQRVQNLRRVYDELMGLVAQGRPRARVDGIASILVRSLASTGDGTFTAKDNFPPSLASNELSFLPLAKQIAESKTISIQYRPIAGKQLTMIMRLVQHFDVTHLSLKRCGLKADDVATIARCLPAKINLLNLWGNQLGDSGILQLLPALQECTELNTLILSWNHMTDACCGEMANWIRSATALRYISFADNPIGEKGGSLLVEAIISNKTICHVGIDYQKTGDEVKKKLMKEVTSRTRPSFYVCNLQGVSVMVKPTPPRE